MTLLIGALGSMGTRYQSILTHLHEPFDCHDPKICDWRFSLEDDVNKKYDRFIIASPTETHYEWVMKLDRFKKPILCEKILSKDVDKVQEMLNINSPLSMMMQYSLMITENDIGDSHYNYYQHGSDGLAWDCFQIIALANGKVELFEDSPIWYCVLNGKRLDKSRMDAAYVEFVRSWLLSGQVSSYEKLSDWHLKVKQYEDEWTLKKSQS